MKLIDLNVMDFTNKLASSDPTPGGGSAAALSGLVGISLAAMVANLTIGRKKYAEYEDFMQTVLADANAQQAALLAGIDLDAEAYDKVSAAYKLPKETDEEKSARLAAIQDALKIATTTPLNILNHCMASLRLAHSMIGKCNTNAASDLGVAAVSLNTGIQGAWMNILINLSGIKDESFKDEARKKAQETLAQAKKLCAEIEAFVMSEIDA